MLDFTVTHFKHEVKIYRKATIRHLLLWVKALAYGNHDSETFDRQKSDDYEGRFRAYCAQAKNEQNRACHQAGTVQYGGL